MIYIIGNHSRSNDLSDQNAVLFMIVKNNVEIYKKKHTFMFR